MNKIYLKRALLFCLAFAFMLGLSQFRAQNDFDKAFHGIKLTNQKSASYTIDIGKEGAIKYLINPNIYTLYLRLDLPDKGNYYCKSDGIEMFLSQGSKKSIWVPLKNNALGNGGKKVPLNVELRVPRDSIKNYNVVQGVIKIYDNTTHYGDINIKIINSRMKS